MSTPTARKSLLRWHHGWIILAIAAVGNYMSAPGQSYSVASFIDPMLVELRLGRTDYSTAYLVATLIGGLTLTYVGRVLDNVGARWTLPVVATLLGGACLWMGQIHTLAGLYLGFTMIRCLGQGSLTLITQWMIGEWFERRRGLAMGLLGLGGTLSVMTVPQINNALIDSVGWRHSWTILAVAVWVSLVLPGLLLIRNRPKDVGQLPDLQHPRDEPLGEEESIADKPAMTGEWTHDPWTPTEAMKTSAFWKLSAVIGTVALVGTGLVFHQVSILGDRGVSRADALAILAVQAVVGTLMSLLAGYVSDFYPARYLLALSMAFLVAGLGVVLAMPMVGGAVFYAVIMGMCGGIIRSVGMVVWLNYFGRASQGSIRGVVMSIMVIAAALGPLPLALAKDLLGSYDVALWLFMSMPLASGLVVLTARPPKWLGTVLAEGDPS